MSPTTPQERYDAAQKELRDAKSEEERFYALNDVIQGVKFIDGVKQTKNAA